MQPLDHFLRRNTDRTNEQFRLTSDNDIHELAELAVGVIILHAQLFRVVSHVRAMRTYVRLPCVSSNLRQGEVNPERCILVLKLRFQLVDRALEYLRAHFNASDDANPTLVPNSAGEHTRADGEHTAFVTAAASLGPAATYSSPSSGHLLPKVHSFRD